MMKSNNAHYDRISNEMDQYQEQIVAALTQNRVPLNITTLVAGLEMFTSMLVIYTQSPENVAQLLHNAANALVNPDKDILPPNAKVH